MSTHVMMTVLGTGYSLTKYRLQDEEQESKLAPVALYHLLKIEGKQPKKILAFCTKEALKVTYPILEDTLKNQCDVDIQHRKIPSGDQEKDIHEFIRIFAESAPKSGYLTVEITHGFRHYALLMLMGSFYVSTLRENLDLRNVYYALLSGTIIDLNQLLELSDWIQATKVFRDTGSSIPIAGLIKKSGSGQNIQKMVKELTKLSRCLTEGLPLEFGLETGRFLKERISPLRKQLRQEHLPPNLSKELAEQVRTTLQSYALEEGTKDKINLCGKEVKRQIKLIDSLYGYGNYMAAFGLMREWLVSWVLWHQKSETKGWLDRKKREEAKRKLDLLAALLNEEKNASIYLTNEQRCLAKFWDELRQIRNLAHHHSMSTMDIFDKKNEKLMERTWKYWNSTMRYLPVIPVELKGVKHNRLIVSPLGNAPGVLFSALRTCCPPVTGNDLCLVITSDQAKSRLKETLEKAEFTGKHEILEFKDPFGGLDERCKLVEMARRSILRSRETHVNLTGGTTLMGLLAEEIAAKAKEYQRLGSRFVLIDQRPPNVQTENPFEVGEKFEVT